MENDAPFEIIAAPAKVWVAPVGTDFPVVDALPDPALWTLLGKAGDKNISEDGVTVSHPQSVEAIRMVGSTGVRKVVRTEEDLMLSFTLADLTLEMYRRVLGVALTEVAAAAGVAGSKKMPLLRGRSVTQFALIAEGPSPYMEDGAMRYKVPIVVNVGEPEVVFQKGEPAGLLFELQAVEHETLGYGELEAQTAVRQ
jgi:hypothetical protein